ncbi:MAG: hypothetical protein IJ086_04885 [Clostridium sp.]|nr:hypothetical protein [Clostridium sp.]
MFDTLITCLVDALKITCRLIEDVLFGNKKSPYNWEKFFLDIKINTKEIKADGNIKEHTDIRLEKIEEQEFYDCYTFVVNYNITAKMLEEKIDNISNLVLKPKEDIRIEQYGNRIYIKLRNNKEMNYEYDPEKYFRRDFKIPVGYNVKNNELILVDLFTSENYGCYLAGSSGGGKSVTLRLILSHLVNCKPKKDLELVIVNTKRVDLKDFQYARNTVKYQVGTQGIEDLLYDELEEMDRRYKLFDRTDCDDIWEYRENIGAIPFRLLVIEEISSYKDNKDYQSYMELLSSQGRGAGIFIILVTQLPSKDIMKNTIKGNMSTIFGHKTRDDIRSKIITGESGLEKLKGKGNNMLYNSQHYGTEYQGLYISKEVMKDIINKHKKKGTNEVAPSKAPVVKNNNLD